MPLPAGITTATVHHDAPMTYGGVPGRVQAHFTPSATLVWEATGTPLAAFFVAASPGNGEPLSIDLPHTDQEGFVDGSGNTLTNWHYTVKLRFFLDGQNMGFPERDFQLSSGQTSVDLALIPFGEAVDPTVAPMAYVTSINGQTGDIEIESLQGPAGPANVLSIGTVTEGPAAATITGTTPAQVLNLVVPKGNTGATGQTGAEGPAGHNPITVSATAPADPVDGDIWFDIS